MQLAAGHTASADTIRAELGVVVIGRNEGERLRRCLEALQGTPGAVVYVDSGSTDDSVDMARGLGVDVVQLDMGRPFTAARARNAGFARLLALRPDLAFVQFIDGDCEIVAAWLSAALAFLAQHPDVACVCGRLRERHPEQSIYNRLCELEWDRPVGETTACGGIAMMRADLFTAVGGFRDDMIAGEEPELCLRLRERGKRVWRLADDMAWHDAAITRFTQWWRRAMRGGYASAEGAGLHGAHPLAGYRRKLYQTMIWGALLPLAIVLPALFVGGWWLLTAAIYPLKLLRLAWRDGLSRSSSWLLATFHVLASFPEAVGALKYWRNQARGRGGRLIEYK